MILKSLSNEDQSLIQRSRAIIFDCDGTLADTMPAHFEAWQATLQRHAMSFSEERFYALGGWPTTRIAELLVKEQAISVNPALIARQKEQAFEESIDRIAPIEPVVEIVRFHAGRRPMAVATGAIRAICERILQQIGLRPLLPIVVSCEDVARHKPHPDVFIEAARRLDVSPIDCVVFEDTDPGIEAARRAQMASIDVRGFFQPRRVSQGDLNRIVD